MEQAQDPEDHAWFGHPDQSRYGSIPGGPNPFCRMAPSAIRPVWSYGHSATRRASISTRDRHRCYETEAWPKAADELNVDQEGCQLWLGQTKIT